MPGKRSRNEVSYYPEIQTFIQDYREESRKKDEQHRQEKKQNMEL